METLIDDIAGDAVRETVSGAVTDAAPGVVSDTAQDAASGVVLGAASDIVPGAESDTALGVVSGAVPEFRLVEFDTVGSTNDLIKQAIERGSEEGLVVRADSQDGGYGRYGRSWSSPLGGLYMSVLLDPASHIEDRAKMAAKLPTLSLLVSIAVRKAILDVVGANLADKVRIKWPNDIVYVGDSDAENTLAMFHKLCGISLEMHGGSVCVGIGINVRRAQTECASECAQDAYARDKRSDMVDAQVPSQVSSQTSQSVSSKVFSKASSNIGKSQESKRNAPVYLDEFSASNKEISISALCESVSQHLANDYSKWLFSPFAAFKQEYNDVLVLNGLEVRIEDSWGKIQIEGRVLGIDDQGCLLVRMHDGRLEHVSSGEAHVSLL